MAFLRGSNRHDSWLQFCRLEQESLAGTGIPVGIYHSEDRFRDLLRDGAAAGQGAAVALVDLSVEHWAALERFVAVFFREYESYAPLDLFPAFRQEVERRQTDFRA